MINKTYSLTLDTKRGVIESPVIVVKGDTGNVFNLRIQDNGTDLDLTSATVLVAFRGAGGSYTQDADTGGVTVDGAVVSFPLYKDSVSEGTNSCDVQIYTDGVLITTAAFTFECRPATVGEDSIRSDASLPILLTLIQEMMDACDRFPAIEVEDIPHGHRINIVNFGGDVTSCDVMDGASGVYVGDGDMPDGYNVQIDSEGNFKVKDALGNVYDITTVMGVGVASMSVTESGGTYSLSYTLTDGTTGTAGALPAATPVGTHTHGNLTYDGKIGSTSGLLVETTTDGAVTASRKIVTGTTAPEDVTGLNAGDIYLYYEV